MRLFTTPDVFGVCWKSLEVSLCLFVSLSASQLLNRMWCRDSHACQHILLSVFTRGLNIQTSICPWLVPVNTTKDFHKHWNAHVPHSICLVQKYNIFLSSYFRILSILVIQYMIVSGLCCCLDCWSLNDVTLESYDCCFLLLFFIDENEYHHKCTF